MPIFIFHLPTISAVLPPIRLYHVVLALHINWKNKDGSPEKEMKKKDVDFSFSRRCSAQHTHTGPPRRRPRGREPAQQRQERQVRVAAVQRVQARLRRHRKDPHQVGRGREPARLLQPLAALGRHRRAAARPGQAAHTERGPGRHRPQLERVPRVPRCSLPQLHWQVLRCTILRGYDETVCYTTLLF